MEVLFGAKEPPRSPEDQAAWARAQPPVLLRRIMHAAMLLSLLVGIAWLAVRYTPLMQWAPFVGAVEGWQAVGPILALQLLNEGVTAYYRRRAAREVLES